MLRKDSERRATLHRVLTDYISHVVSNIQESVPQVGKKKKNPTSQSVSIGKVLAHTIGKVVMCEGQFMSPIFLDPLLV